MKLRILAFVALLLGSLAISITQRRAIKRTETTISNLAVSLPRPLDLEPLRTENRRLSDKITELSRLRASSRELPQLRARLAQLKERKETLPQQAAAEDEASLTEDEKLLKRLKEIGLKLFSEEDMPTLIRILKEPPLFSKIDVNQFNQVRHLDRSVKAELVREVIPAVTDALKNEDQWTRWMAAMLLGAFGTDAKPAVPALIEALETRHGADWGLQLKAASSLWMIGPEASEAVPALIRTLQSEEAGLRATACLALGGIGPGAKEAVPFLIQAAQDENEDVRKRGLEALQKIDPNTISANRTD